jgi:hypothetical protein
MTDTRVEFTKPEAQRLATYLSKVKGLTSLTLSAQYVSTDVMNTILGGLKKTSSIDRTYFKITRMDTSTIKTVAEWIKQNIASTKMQFLTFQGMKILLRNSNSWFRHSTYC